MEDTLLLQVRDYEEEKSTVKYSRQWAKDAGLATEYAHWMRLSLVKRVYLQGVEYWSIGFRVIPGTGFGL